MTNPEQIYQEQIQQLTNTKKTLLIKRNRLGWLRFLCLAAAILFTWLSWPAGALIIIPGLILCVACFLFVLSKDISNNNAIGNADRLLEINETEIKLLSHQFTQLPDGKEFLPADHDYAHDLDIFGRSPVYQYTNRAQTEQGRKLFANWLLYPALPAEIKDRQDAVKELASQTAWRQQLQAYGLAEQVTGSAEKSIQNWLGAPQHFIHAPLWKTGRWLFPLLSCTWLALHITGVVDASLFYPVVIIFLSGSMLITKKVMPVYKQLDKTAPQLQALSNSAAWIENGAFTATRLKELQQQYTIHKHNSSYTIHKLRKILDMLDIRLNPLVFIPANTFLFWDLQQVFALEQWKEEHKDHISHWFEALAEMESLASLGTLSFNNPDWAFPQISKEEAVFEARALGHPLIPASKRITSSFTVKGRPQLNLVTGSNMAGKSTFLRSVGVNAVLALAGAPVCAAALTISPMKIMSSMRVSDNLEESTSTFYAELKKLKDIIEAVNRKEKVFLLLDEILRGTNSADRHAGSEALIRQLLQQEGAGLIATHDLELARLSEQFPGRIHNYHFDVQVSGTELFFDYRLKEGVCTSMNASLLMKKIGIEL